MEYGSFNLRRSRRAKEIEDFIEQGDPMMRATLADAKDARSLAISYRRIAKHNDFPIDVVLRGNFVYLVKRDTPNA